MRLKNSPAALPDSETETEVRNRSYIFISPVHMKSMTALHTVHGSIQFDQLPIISIPNHHWGS